MQPFSSKEAIFFPLNQTGQKVILQGCTLISVGLFTE